MGKFDGSQEWYLGLDIGTNSVGWAVTDLEYNILRFNGNAMWGVYLFDEAKTSAERRTNRTARRRLERKKQRIGLLQEFFAREIADKDDKFYIRLKESGLWADDRTTDIHLFNGNPISDKDYSRLYPTIHHLIVDLIENKEYHDPRLVYLACSYILSHRGHFLFEVSIDGNVTDFDSVYNELLNWFESCDIQLPWDCSSELIGDIISKNKGISKKIEAFKSEVFNGKFPTDKDTNEDLSTEEMTVRVSVKCLVELICGKKTDLSKLFLNESYKALEKNSISASSADYEDSIDMISGSIDRSEYDLLCVVKKIYDWSLLEDILSGESMISKAKINVYNQHRADLSELKYFIKKYVPQKYNQVFRKVCKDPNYVSYSYNINDLGKCTPVPSDYKKCSAEQFCDYIRKILEPVSGLISDADVEKYNDMIERLKIYTFCPKQMTSDNRVIPYQLYYRELRQILENASGYLPFLNDCDKYGSVKDKILSIMRFRIPYYVGPLNNSSEFAWIKKKSDAKIYPWNFDEVVDKDASEEEFINRMTGKCTYLPGEDVLPKNSLIYNKYVVLNEINNLRINENKISVELKQAIYNDLFMKKRRVTRKILQDYLLSNGHMQKDDEIRGIDNSIKSNLGSYHDFKSYLESGVLLERDVESIILRITTTNDRGRLKKWIMNNYKLSDEDVKAIVRLKYADFGRLSKRLLTEVYDLDKDTGEIRREENIIGMLWNTNDNLMMLMSKAYGFADHINDIRNEYYDSKPQTLDKQLEDMYISNSVKRPILRTFDIVNELRRIMMRDPNKIFVEMARGATQDQKNKRTKSRRDQLTELIAECKKNGDLKADLDHLLDELNSKSDSDLRSEKLYLYFTQLGRCMYSGQPIDINDLGNNKLYDVDHIWPRSKVKDDSISNKVLVLSKYNGTKGDNYPVPEEWRVKQYGFWESLFDKDLISEEKFNRLKRTTRFTDEELASFINRQLVETRQTTKAVASILEKKFSRSKIVYVKAGLVSEFRQIYKDNYFTLKCREVNDLHHAKDAYLNIVLGNVYNVRFTENPLNIVKAGEQYTLNLNKILERDVHRGSETAWIAKDDEWFNRVINTIHKNNIRFVRYSFCQKGALFDIKPLRKGQGQVPRKDYLNDIDKYGGYNKQTYTGFVLISYMEKKKREVALFPVPLLKYDCLKSISDLEKCCISFGYEGAKVLLNGRIIKTNTLFEVDGYRVHLSGKSSGDVWFKGAQQLVLPMHLEMYLKKICNYYERTKGNKELPELSLYDGIDSEINSELYVYLTNKMTNTAYNTLMPTARDTLISGRTMFDALSVEEQAIALYHIVELFGCSNSQGKDLTLIGGAKSSGIQKMTLKLNRKRFKTLSIVDQSPTGLFEKKSVNLIEL
ncbi:MAG: type II CRISPR RNA-guided endonuclease Cas9 [Clostridiales bacterium]|nr:type II CRISPR RNA-guided endonuclease Cas9 [Clostridiales bacterium]